jgi:arylformamidase
MTIYDISLTISEDFPTWPGDPPIELKMISQIDKGDLANVTHLSAPVHMGTHVDAPDHFLNNGNTVVDIPLDYLVGPVLVLEVPSPEVITAGDLDALKIPEGIRRIIFKTSNSDYWKEETHAFQKEFVALSADAAARLVELGLNVVGVDYLSVAPYDEPIPTHKILLEAGVLIIEGLDLSRVSAGEYKLYCLPLKIAGSDGAPARVLLED